MVINRELILGSGWGGVGGITPLPAPTPHNSPPHSLDLIVSFDDWGDSYLILQSTCHIIWKLGTGTLSKST